MGGSGSVLSPTPQHHSGDRQAQNGAINRVKGEGLSYVKWQVFVWPQRLDAATMVAYMLGMKGGGETSSGQVA